MQHNAATGLESYDDLDGPSFRGHLEDGKQRTLRARDHFLSLSATQAAQRDRLEEEISEVSSVYGPARQSGL